MPETMKITDAMVASRWKAVDAALAAAFTEAERSSAETHVRFGSVNAGSQWHTRFGGITMKTRNARNTVSRRVMLKNDTIDLDAIRTKAAELVEIDKAAVKQRQRQAEAAQKKAREDHRRAHTLAELLPDVVVVRVEGDEVYMRGTYADVLAWLTDV